MQKLIKHKKLIIFLLLSLLICLNFYIYRNEFIVKSDPNDNIFQYALVNDAKDIWQKVFSGKLSPFYLLDSWNERWAEGLPLSQYYAHLPQDVISLVNFVIPVDSFNFFVILRTLIFIFLPIMFFWGGSVLEFPMLQSFFVAVLSQLIFTNGLYGIDVSSFIWRGWGLSAQLLAVFFMPPAFAYGMTYLEKKKNLKKAILFNFIVAQAHIGIFLILLISYGLYLPFKIVTDVCFGVDLAAIKNQRSKIKSLIQSINFSLLWSDTIRPFILFIGVTLFSLSYFIIPFFIYGNYRNFSLWDPIWKFDSWGAKQILIWFLNGELFDFNRFPVITLSVLFGVLIGLSQIGKPGKKERLISFISILTLIYFVLFFGRTTLGKLVDLIPGFSEYHIHRLIVMFQFTSLFLASWFLYKVLHYLFSHLSVVDFTKFHSSFTKGSEVRSNNLKNVDDVYFSNSENKSESRSTSVIFTKLNRYVIIIFILTISLISFYFLEKPVIKYANDNNLWILRSNISYLLDLSDFNKLEAKLSELPQARVYAGRPGNWGRNFFVGETPLYMALSRDGFSVIGFLPESWSMNSDPEQFFDENNILFYDLYNVRYSILPTQVVPPKFAKPLFKAGKFNLYEIKTDGWVAFGKSRMMVRSRKTDLLNATRLWFDSDMLKAADYPVIEVNNTISLDPSDRWSGKLWQVQLTDLNHFINLNDQKERDIWLANPFSALSEKSTSVSLVSKNEQKLPNGYAVNIHLDKDCGNCILLLKQSYHPDWQAILDGSRVSTFPVFPFYVGIQIEKAGNHHISFEYEPNNYKVILVWLEILTLILWLINKKFKIVKFN